MADYGFPRDPWRSNSDFWSWTQTADNVLWPDPTALREESCKPSPNADLDFLGAGSLDGARGWEDLTISRAESEVGEGQSRGTGAR